MASDQTESDANDLVAVHRVLSGNREAFRAIVEKYQSRLYRFCLARTGDEEAARDTVQDIFVRAYRSLARFRVGASFQSWLYAIAGNCLKTRWKRRRTEAERLMRVYEPVDDDRDDTAGAGLAALEAERLRSAMGDLKPELAAVLELYYFEGLSVGETAAVLGIGTENVKTRLFRGRKKLRELLGRPQPGSR